MNQARATDIVFFAFAAVVYVIQLVLKARRDAQQQRLDDELTAVANTPARQSFVVPADGHKSAVLARLADAATRATALAESVRQEPRNQRFLHVLEAWIPGYAQGYAQWLTGRMDAAAAEQSRAAVAGLERVLAEVTELVRQRRESVIRDDIGEADALADACYAPILAFARAHDLPVTSAFPATQWAEFDLSIWSGFAPTSIAPIFLPPDFFSRAAWWPALAHEIGHDFLVSLPSLDARLRTQLGVPSVREGAMPLQATAGDALTLEARRLYGVWFEETFCDVFGTLMCGPGYVASMIELFAPDPEDPEEAREVALNPDARGQYDPHPPQHLRVLTCLAVLERVGLHDDVRALSRRWNSLALEGETPDEVYVPVFNTVVTVPTETFMTRARELVEALCAGQLEGLSGFSLTDIPGLDYGPHEHAATLRARTALAAGRIPDTRDPRAIVSGAVLAAIEHPSREAVVLKAARAAIPSLGAIKARPDAYSMVQAPRDASAKNVLVEALILREVLGAPRGRRHGGSTPTSRL